MGVEAGIEAGYRCWISINSSFHISQTSIRTSIDNVRLASRFKRLGSGCGGWYGSWM
jgi:hypothetical protein